MSTTKYLDLDAVLPERTLIVTLNGQKHTQVAMSVDGYLATQAMAAKAGLITTPEEEIDLVKDMLIGFFPTMTKEMLGKLTIDQLNALQAAAKGSDESVANDAAEADAQAAVNPPVSAIEPSTSDTSTLVSSTSMEA